MRALAFVFLALAFAVPAAAQTVPGDLGEMSTSTAIGSEPLSATNATTVPVTLTVECAILLASPNVADVDFTVEGAEAHNFTAEIAAVAVGPADCANQSTPGVATKTADLIITPGPTTPGKTTITLWLNATRAGAATDPAGMSSEEIPFQFEYRPCYAVSPPSGTRFQVQQVPFNFTYEGTMCGNAMSMIMVTHTIEAGRLSGLQPVDGDPLGPQGGADGVTVSRTLSFTPPEADWTTVNATARFYTHYMEPGTGAGEGEYLPMEVTWTFVNDGAEPAGNGGGDGGEDSPGAGLAAVLAALAAVAFLARRKA